MPTLLAPSTRPLTQPSTQPRTPWDVARLGRLLAGASILLFTLLGFFLHPMWLFGTMLSAINLIATSLTNRCLLRNVLVRLGAREREDIYLPGGRLRSKGTRLGLGRTSRD